MIDFKIISEEAPETNKRVAIQLSDGRVCSGVITDTDGFRLEAVSPFDILKNVENPEQKWIYLDE